MSVAVLSAGGLGAFSSGLAASVGGKSASSGIAKIAEQAKSAGAGLIKLAATLPGSGAEAADAAAPEGQVPDETPSNTSVGGVVEGFLESLEKELSGLPDQFKSLLETSGKDALAAITDPLKEAGQGLLDNLLGGLFGGKPKGEEKKADGEGDKPSVGDQIGKNLKGVLKGFGDSFKNIFKGLGDKFKSLFGDLTKSLGGLFEGLLGNLSGLFGGEGGGGLGAVLGSIGTLFGFAGGGRIQPGVPAVVGERGPELIVPNRPGTVMNAADSRRAGGKAVAVNQTVNFDLVPSPTISAMIDAKRPEIERAAIAGTLKALNRGNML